MADSTAMVQIYEKNFFSQKYSRKNDEMEVIFLEFWHSNDKNGGF